MNILFPFCKGFAKKQSGWARSSAWIERLPSKSIQREPEVEGSKPSGPVLFLSNEKGEHASLNTSRHSKEGKPVLTHVYKRLEI